MKTLPAVLLIVSIAIGVNAQRIEWPKSHMCGENEVFRLCGPSCPPTCPSVFYHHKMPCVQMCRMGCACRSGFLRNAFGVCVPPSECFANKLYQCLRESPMTSLVKTISELWS